MKITTVGASWVGTKHRGHGPWLDVVHEVNRTRPGTFGTPEIARVEGVYTEVYPGAEIRHVGTGAQDTLVTIASTDDDVVKHLVAACEKFGLVYVPERIEEIFHDSLLDEE